jgi:acyl-CoA oxidase
MLSLLMDAKDIKYCEMVTADIKQHPDLLFTPSYLELDRAGQMEAWWKRLRLMYEISRDRYFYDETAMNQFRWKFYQGACPIYLSTDVYYNVIAMMGSERQREMWIEPNKRLEIIGCYAQTELGHGSNVAKLETTATFDRVTDEFILNSPTLTSTKFWPGNMGIWSNWAAVYARLIIDGKDFGVQCFNTQIRDTYTREMIKGVNAGDIGAKLGMKTNDNGWMFFNQVRIPRTNMLDKFCEVTREGKFIVKGNPKLLYQVMVNTR